MRCSKVQRLLPGLADGDMEPVLFRRVQEHLEGCPACREEAESYRKLQGLIGGDPVPEAPLPNGREAAAWILRQDVERRRPGWLRFAGPRVVYGAAGLALATVVAGVLGVAPGGKRSPAARSGVPAPEAPLPALVVVDDEETGRQVMLAPSLAAAPDDDVSTPQ